MKVTVKREQTTSFEKLREGDCFRYNKSVYLKTCRSLGDWNAFNLKENYLDCFYGAEEVVLVEAELIIS